MKLTKELRGKLLVSAPAILDDASFNRSLILVAEHSTDSSLGFIMNRPSKFTLNDLLPDVNCNFTVFKGGPVETDNIYFIHNIPHLIPNSIKIKEKLHWGGNFETVIDLINKKKIDKSEIKFFKIDCQKRCPSKL